MPLKMHADEPTAMNLTSMIDVLFLLIMFFMLATRFNDHERQLDIHLPTANAANLKNPESRHHQVNIHRDGTLDVDGRPSTLEDLRQFLFVVRQNPTRPQVYVRYDEDASMKAFAGVSLVFQQTGVDLLSMGVTTQPLR